MKLIFLEYKCIYTGIHIYLILITLIHLHLLYVKNCAYLANFKQNWVKNLRDDARLSLMTGRFCLRWPVRADI